jgi:epoxide hydrolase 4
MTMDLLVEHHTIDTNGIRLHVAQAGPQKGPLVIMLHGFPEFWRGWRSQIPVLAEAGFRLWIPDQRGYNLSEKPTTLEAYNLDELAKDVVGLIDAAGVERCFLVGHDWGAAVAWWVAAKHPDRLKKLAVINVPHHAVMSRTLQTSYLQKLRSWYMFFFQLPLIPEFCLSLAGFRMLESSLVTSARPGTFSLEEMVQYRQAWAQPGALTGMINWYRALFRNRPKPPKTVKIEVPTMLIWGAGDRFLGREMAQPSIDLCEHGRLVMIDEATHWVHHEESGRVNALLDQFFREDA